MCSQTKPFRLCHFEFEVKGAYFMDYILFFCQKMLEYLKDKKDVGFFLSVQALMQTCWSVFNQ